MKNLYVRQIHKDFFGKVQRETEVGPYGEEQTYVLHAQYCFDMDRQKPDTVQITKWELILRDENGEETVLDTRGY